VSHGSSSSFDDILPLLLLGERGHRDLLPLLLLLSDRDTTTHTETDTSSSSDDPGSIPTTFNAYLATLVGDLVRVSVTGPGPVDNAFTLLGTLTDVGTDFIVLRGVIASSVPVGLRTRVAIPISHIQGIDRVPLFDVLFPLLRSTRGS
jgi:hypothetical protein